MVFSSHLIGFLLRATRKEQKSRLRYYVSPKAVLPGKTSKAVFLASERNTLQQVETFKYVGVVFTRDGSRHKGIDTRIGEASAGLREFIARWWRNRGFQTTQSFQFLNPSFSDPYLRSWILGDDWKDTVKRINGRDGIFAKSFRCDTSWQRAQVWNP